MSKAVVDLLKQKFGAAILATMSQHGDEAVLVDPKRWVAIHTFLRDDPGCQMSMLVDLCGVDYPDRDPRFEVVTHLYSLAKKHRLRVKAAVGTIEAEDVRIDTLAGVWGAADWLERETWDLMGVTFVGHPDPRRILLYEEFEGHPLRKDYRADHTQPLVPYREGPEILDKLAPFGTDEGMPFGRQSLSTTKPS